MMSVSSNGKLPTITQTGTASMDRKGNDRSKVERRFNTKGADIE